MDRNYVRKAIATLEYYENGMDHSSGSSVKVTNLRLRKKKPTMADVTLCFREGKRTEKHCNLEYDLQALGTARKLRGSC